MKHLNYCFSVMASVTNRLILYILYYTLRFCHVPLNYAFLYTYIACIVYSMEYIQHTYLAQCMYIYIRIKYGIVLSTGLWTVVARCLLQRSQLCSCTVHSIKN